MSNPTEAKAKPILPTVNDLNRPFWEGCKSGQFLLQECAHCHFKRYPAAPSCPKCLAVESTWQPASGRAELFSYVIFERAYNPAWEGRTPYNVSLVELEEGPIVLSNVIDIPNTDLKIGMKLNVTFRQESEVSIPVFKPA